jgi:hypothetical protein
VKDFEWLTGKAEKHGYTFTKEDFSVEECEKMGFDLKQQLSLLTAKQHDIRTAMNFSMLILASTFVFGLPAFAIGIGMLGGLSIAFIKHTNTKKEIVKLMYLRSLHR